MEFQDEDTSSISKSKLPCSQADCQSSDAVCEYSNGQTHCFSCNHHTFPTGAGTNQGDLEPVSSDLIEVEIPSTGLMSRGITLETLKKFKYGIGKDRRGDAVQVAQYRDKGGRVSGQKLRYANKDFKWVGESKKTSLFGAHLWGKGKTLVITEGELDCLSLSQAQGNKWPVTSLPNGAASAKKDLMRNLSYLDGFNEITLCFDSDKAGQEAAIECAEALLPKRVRIVSLPLKDANEMLLAKRADELISLLFSAPEYKPDGIISFWDLESEVLKDPVSSSVRYPYSRLNFVTKGLRTSELVTIAAGSGVGKSAFVREVIYGLHQSGEPVGAIMLEESGKRTADGLVGLHLNKPIHISRDGVTSMMISDAMADMKRKNKELFLFDHFGSTEIDKLLNRIRFMAKSLECRWIILDHLGIVISGLATNDERRAIDEAMTALRTLVQDCDIGLVLVSHLSRPEGKGHEQGAEVSLKHMRGSHSIVQLSDFVIALERNQQDEDEENRNTTKVRVLKNRLTGETGPAGLLVYRPDTGRLIDKPEFQGEF